METELQTDYIHAEGRGPSVYALWLVAMSLKSSQVSKLVYSFGLPVGLLLPLGLSILPLTLP